MRVSKIWEPAADDRVALDDGLAAQDHVGLEGHVLPDAHALVDIGRGRVHDGHTRLHVGLEDAQAHLQLSVGQLGAVVDAQKRAVVLDLERDHGAVVAAGERDELRQVELAGDGAGLDITDTQAQPVGVERVEPGVDLADLALGGTGVLVLDDAGDAVVVITSDASEHGRVVHIHADERRGGIGSAPSLGQLCHQPRIDERHVTREHDDLAHPGGQVAQCGRHGVGRAARLGLDGEVGLAGEDLGDLGHGRADDHERGGIGGSHGSGEDIRQHGTPADGMEHLGSARTHSCTEPGGHHDRYEGLVLVGVHEGALPPFADGGCSGIRSHEFRGDGAPMSNGCGRRAHSRPGPISRASGR